MNSLPKLTEADIDSRVTDSSFDRGHDYYRDGAVLEISKRGSRIIAEVEGSGYEPYKVSVTLSERGIEDTSCSCPYDWGGDCKHIVAVILTYIHSLDEIEELPSVESMLADLDREQLQKLILDLVDFEPSLADVIQGQISAMQAAAPEPSPEPMYTVIRKRHTELDQNSFRRQVRSVFHRKDYMRSSDAYWNIEGMAGDLRKILEKAREFVEAGDGDNAIIVLEAVTEGCLDELDFLVEDPEIFFDDIGPLWTESILSADLSPSQGEKLAERLAEWSKSLSDYGIEDAFDAAQAAAIQGWDHPSLKRVLSGEITSLGAWDEEAPWYADDLAIARLNVLARQGRTEEYLYLAEAEGQMECYLTMLAQLGRIQEAVDYGLKYMESADEALSLAQALYEQGETDSALHVADHGLKLQGDRSELARWIRGVAATAGKPEEVLNAAVIAIRESPSLEDYQNVERLSGERWPELREEILKHLRQMKPGYSEAQVDIFLHEGLIDDAINALGDYSGHTLLRKVVDAAISTHSDWVISTSRHQAEYIMDAGKASAYRYAADWLEKARAAYLATGREAEWQEYLSEILDKHQRKYKLIPMLKALL